MNNKDYSYVRVNPISGALGAVVEGIDLGKPIAEPIFAEIYKAFLEFKVIFFRDQELSPETQLRFGKMFGQPIIYPFVKGLKDFPEITPILKKKTDLNNFGGVWHSDTTYQEKPPKATMLYAVEVPEVGGDTEFANQCMALDHLSDGMQKFLKEQRVINSSGKGKVVASRSDVMKHSSSGQVVEELRALHPVIRTHPETKEQALFINEAHSLKFSSLSLEESTPLLEFLFKHQIKSEFTCRFKWENGSVAIWDNRCTLHNPINDYHGKRRLMHRITFAGDTPV
jgi:taurine dioxygenase